MNRNGTSNWVLCGASMEELNRLNIIGPMEDQWNLAAGHIDIIKACKNRIRDIYTPGVIFSSWAMK